MDGALPMKEIDFNREEFKNALVPIEVSALGKLIDSRFGIPANVELPIDARPAPIVTVCRLLAPLNAKLPIEVTEFGIVIAVRPVP